MEAFLSFVTWAALGVAFVLIDFVYEMLGVALRAVSVFGFWSAAICALWGVATLYRVVVRWVKH